MNSTIETTAQAAGNPTRVRPVLLPWQTPLWVTLLLAVLAGTVLLLAAYCGGFFAGRNAAHRHYAKLLATHEYYLPVDSRQLTVAVVPLALGPQASRTLADRNSAATIAAAQLVATEGLTELTANLAELYPLGYRVGEPLTIPDEFFSVQRQQYRADKVLNWLVKTAGHADFRTVGVLDCDIYVPDYNFLFGLAKTGGNACVVSSARMGIGADTARLTPAERWHSIVRHELGHTLGLLHNESERSVMVYGDSLSALDQQITNLSLAEWRQLEEIHPIIWHR
jgi:archaemetzincin